MAKTKAEKRKAREKAKKLDRRKAQHAESKNLKSEFYYDEAMYLLHSDNYEKALTYLQKAIKLSPADEYYLKELINIGQEIGRNDVLLIGLDKLYRLSKLDNDYLPLYVNALVKEKRFQDALYILEVLLACLPKMKTPKKGQLKSQIAGTQEYCRLMLKHEKSKPVQPITRPTIKQKNPEPAVQKENPQPPPGLQKPDLPEISATFAIDICGKKDS